jgi:CheY-like chemotaxis protein
MAKESGVSGARTGTPRRRRADRFGHVLIVEDEPLLAAAVEQALRDEGATSVAVSSSASEAMAALNRKRPEVLILDVNLADRNDGWAIAELVVTLNPRHPRIIFSTGSPERIPEHIAELGTVLAKPYAPEELVRVLGKMSGPRLLDRLRGAISTS